MPILDRSTLVTLTNDTALSSTSTYSNAYIAAVIAEVTAEMTTFLHYSPILQVVQGEEGIVRYVTDGVYAGRYYAELMAKPLIPGPATTIFQNLQLTYALAYSGPTNVSLSLVQVTHPTGEIFALGPGMVEALAGVTFSFAAPKPAVYATGYVTSYCAGYSTGISDPVPNGGGTTFTASLAVAAGQITGGTVLTSSADFTSPPILVVSDSTGNGGLVSSVLTGAAVTGIVVQAPGQGYTAPTVARSAASSFGAQSIPTDITQAAVMLCRERIAYDDALNAGVNLLSYGGMLSELSSTQQTIRFLPMNKNLPPTNLGYGGFLAQQATAKLKRYVKRRMPDWLGGVS